MAQYYTLAINLHTFSRLAGLVNGSRRQKIFFAKNMTSITSQNQMWFLLLRCASFDGPLLMRNADLIAAYTIEEQVF
jgi:hypothetical protein